MTDPNCIFCKIAAGEAPASVVYEDEEFIVFHDRKPIAPVHLLVLPRQHLGSLEAISEADAGMLGRLMMVARGAARQLGLPRDGYRLVLNVGGAAGQSVWHLHFHLVGGRKLTPHFA